MASAIEQIYDKLMEVFGGTNPNQVFTMLMPGTTLDAKTFAFDPEQPKPDIVKEAESKLVDQMFDIAKVTGSSNGQRVSSQYIQALSVLVPTFNPMMAKMKSKMRDFISGPVPDETTLNGRQYSGTREGYYFELFDGWVQALQEWETKKIDKKKEFATQVTANQLTQQEAMQGFHDWYAEVAQGELAKVDATFGKMVTAFAPADMNAILGALESGPGGEFHEASNIVRDNRYESENGGFYYPVDLSPDDWFLALKSDLNPVDLLKDPDFIKKSIAARSQALQASIAQVQALMSTMSTDDDIRAAADTFDTNQKSYLAAQNGLLTTYTDNAKTAVDAYLDYSAANTAEEKENVKKHAVTAVAEGQKALIAAQSNLQSSLEAVASAGAKLAGAKSGKFEGLDALKKRLESQLDDIQNMGDELVASITHNPPPIQPAYDISADIKKDIQNAVKAAAVAAKSPNAAHDTVVEAFNTSPTTTNPAATIDTATDSAITALKVDVASIDTAKTAQQTLAEITQAVNRILRVPSSSKSVADDRFMDLQFSFHSNEMDKGHSEDTHFSQMSWSVDLFFGSASGSSSSSSSVTKDNALEKDTEIKIGLKAAKVDVRRGWFDPGVFKLSNNASRLSKTLVSSGSLPSTAGIWSDTTKHNNAILPCFPVAFVVAKDVTISFKATESSLDGLHSVMDSASAVGGGFLCFSASSSSSSHGDHSSLHTKSQDTVITITMPGPQILGWFLEFTPKDKSEELTSTTRNANYLTILDYVDQLANSNH